MPQNKYQGQTLRCPRSNGIKIKMHSRVTNESVHKTVRTDSNIFRCDKSAIK